MIIISVPDNFLHEREYIISILFGEYLGISYEIIPLANLNNYELLLENGNSLIIPDAFFSKCDEVNGYLRPENIPHIIEFAQNNFLKEKDLPVIYGNTEVKVNILERDNSKSIYCGIDIFASSFFMLTRWEEYVIKVRDEYERFPYNQSLAYIHNFLNRPVVNEYLEFLWNMLIELDYPQKRVVRDFRLIVTHDVDSILKWISFKGFMKSLSGDLLNRKNPILFLKNILRYFLFKLGKVKDYYDTFDYLMTASENVGVKSHFFFMAGGTSKEDNRYSINHPFIKPVFKQINDRGHFIGIHPSFNTYNDKQQFQKELFALSGYSPQPIVFGRQHFLRFEVPRTWQIWEDLGMEWDSSIYYSQFVGFRAGTCWEYSVYNILTRRKLKLRERPLIFMESTFNPLNSNHVDFEQTVMNVLHQTISYNGDFVLLWHNSNFHTNDWEKYSSVYEKILDQASGLAK